MILTTQGEEYLKEYLLASIDKVRFYSENYNPLDPPTTYVEKDYNDYAIIHHSEMPTIKSVVFLNDTTPLLYINNLSITPSPEFVIRLEG